MQREEKITAGTTLVLGDRVFGIMPPCLEPAWYHLGAWHQATQRWVLFKYDVNIGALASLGMTLGSEQLAAHGFTRATDRMDARSPVYIVVPDGKGERSIEVPVGTDPKRYRGSGEPGNGRKQGI